MGSPVSIVYGWAGQIVDLLSPYSLRRNFEKSIVDDVPYRSGVRGLNPSWFRSNIVFGFGRYGMRGSRGALLGGGDLFEPRLQLSEHVVDGSVEFVKLFLKIIKRGIGGVMLNAVFQAGDFLPAAVAVGDGPFLQFGQTRYRGNALAFVKIEHLYEVGDVLVPAIEFGDDLIDGHFRRRDLGALLALGPAAALFAALPTLGRQRLPENIFVKLAFSPYLELLLGDGHAGAHLKGVDLEFGPLHGAEHFPEFIVVFTDFVAGLLKHRQGSIGPGLDPILGWRLKGHPHFDELVGERLDLRTVFGKEGLEAFHGGLANLGPLFAVEVVFLTRLLGPAKEHEVEQFRGWPKPFCRGQVIGRFNDNAASGLCRVCRCLKDEEGECKE